MSGNFGWAGKNNPPSQDPASSTGGGFTQARGAYQGFGGAGDPVKKIGVVSKAKVNTVVPSTPVSTHLNYGVVPTATHSLKSGADYVLIVALDGTGSMGKWKDEIRKRLAMLYILACEYLNTSNLEILFIVFGDTRCPGERYPLQVARFGQGPELEAYLNAFRLEGGGGANGGESSELAAYYVAERIDLSSARRVYYITITDDAAFPDVRSSDVQTYLGVVPNPRYVTTKNVFAALLERMEVFVVFCETTSATSENVMKWRVLVGEKRVAPLDDERRVVDVILGILATTVGKSQAFLADLKSRHAGSQYAAVNVQAVSRSIAMIGNQGAPLQPMRLSPGALRASRLLTDGDPDPSKK
jgi:hypothetical protein